MTPGALQRRHDPREVVNAVRWLVGAGAPWRSLPTTFPPWKAVSQQTRRWLDAGCFEAMVRDPRVRLRWLHGRADTTAAILDSAMWQSTPASGARAGYDGYTRRQRSKSHLAIDTLGHLLTRRVTPADAQDRVQAERLAEPDVTGETMELVHVDQGDTGDGPAQAVAFPCPKRTKFMPGSSPMPRRTAMSAFTEDELGYLLGERRLARLATVGRDGMPHVAPVGWSYPAELDTIDVGGRDLERTTKYRDLARTGRAAIVIDDVLPPWQPRGVEVRGRTNVLTEPAPLIRIHPQRIISWGIASTTIGQRHARAIA